MMLARYLGGLLGGIGWVLRRILGWFWGGLGWFWGGGKWGISRGDCKKMQKKCKKMQKYLHMSKKSCNFASDFNSGVRNNLKYQRVMEKVEILKVDCKPRKVRVYRIDLSEGASLFVVYEGRKKVEQPNTFLNYYASLKRCMIVALGNMGYIKMKEAEV